MDAPPVQYVRTRDGCDIAYGISGSGQLLVRLPVVWNHFSLQWNPGLLGPEFQAFASRFQFVQYDSRGQGLSSRGLTELTASEEFDWDLEAVIQCLPKEQTVLFAPSASGLTAIRRAVRMPERTRALILWNYLDAQGATYISPMQQLAAIDWDTYIETTARIGFPTKDPELVKAVMRETMTQADFAILSRVLRTAKSDDLLPLIDVPTLVLASRSKARAFPNEESARRLAAQIPKAKLVLLDGPGGGLDSVNGGVPPAIVAIDEFLMNLPDTGRSPVDPSGESSSLSSRELDVLRLVARGRSNAQIAAELVISQNTVIRHVSNIFAKIGAENRTEAAVYARDHGIA
jgi:DNA-binding CsgD family transcriptional regulator/pimeloyl-ACP methyl ester carboxylesterase